MAPWMLSALRLLGITAGGTFAGTQIERFTGVDIPFIGDNGEKPGRRRRRRMLTASDVKDIAFLQTVLSGKNLAAVIAARVAR